MKTRFQIRDDNFGIAIYEGESAEEALLDFLADQRRGELRPLIRLARNGDFAAIEVGDDRYHAVACDERVPPDVYRRPTEDPDA